MLACSSLAFPESSLATSFPSGSSDIPRHARQSTLSTTPACLTGPSSSHTGTCSHIASKAPQASLCSTKTTTTLEIEKGVAFIYSKITNAILPRRQPIATQSLLTVQIIWGQVRNYPQMMIEGQLPPTIYPPCVLRDKLVKDCVVSGTHTCLPEALAICTSIVRMFYARTKENSAFLWRNIHAEQQRLRQEVRSACRYCETT